MHCFSVLVLFLLCSLRGLYVGSNGSSNSNNGLFYFNGNNTPDGNNNAARLIQSEVLRGEIPLPKKQSQLSIGNTIQALASHSSHCVEISAMKTGASRSALERHCKTKG